MPLGRAMQRVEVIDSHTGGEPTRVVLRGGPDLGRGTMAERLELFRTRHDQFRSALVNEPRGSDVWVGALLCEPHDPSCAAGVIFFNNVGYLGMCGHGTMGVVVTLAHLGRIREGEHRIETPVGVVTTTLHPDGSVSVANVPCYRRARTVTVQVPAADRAPNSGSARPATPVAVTGDVAWGGNWFFLVTEHGQRLELQNVEQLTEFAWRVRQAVNRQGYPQVDHIELFGPATQPGAHARNFVLCPGKAYDRSPCGTGTSAKLACLSAEGQWGEDQVWIQESILGSTFAGRYRWLDRSQGTITPIVTGTAFVNAEASLLLAERDPFCWGIPAGPQRLRQANDGPRGR